MTLNRSAQNISYQIKSQQKLDGAQMTNIVQENRTEL